MCAFRPNSSQKTPLGRLWDGCNTFIEFSRQTMGPIYNTILAFVSFGALALLFASIIGLTIGLSLRLLDGTTD